MKQKLLNKYFKLTKKVIIKAIKDTNNLEIISDGLYILNKIDNQNQITKLFVLLMVKENLNPELLLRNLVACQAVVCSEIYFFDLEMKKMKNFQAIKEFFQNLATSALLRSPIAVILPNFYKIKIKDITELETIDLVRKKRYFWCSHLIGEIFTIVVGFNKTDVNQYYYYFGFYLSLYFLLHREFLARKAKIPSLLDQIVSQELLIIKLQVMERYINAISNLYPIDFNQFIILNNKLINQMKYMS